MGIIFQIFKGRILFFLFCQKEIILRLSQKKCKKSLVFLQERKFLFEVVEKKVYTTIDLVNLVTYLAIFVALYFCNLFIAAHNVSVAVKLKQQRSLKSKLFLVEFQH